jgi:DNA-binding MarR family transcriptional regulator
MGQALENPLQRQPGYAVKRLQLAMRHALDAAMRPTELSMAQFGALRILTTCGPMPAATLARRCFITRQSMRDVLRGLRARQLIETTPSAEGQLRRLITITPIGQRLAEQAMTLTQDVNHRMMRGLTPRQQAQLVTWLNTCADNLLPPRPTVGPDPRSHPETGPPET